MERITSTGDKLMDLKAAVLRRFRMDKYGNMVRKEPTRNGMWVVGTLDASTGYMKLKLLGRTRYVHRLVWLVRTDSMPPKIGHKDGNKRNNNFSNLHVLD